MKRELKFRAWDGKSWIGDGKYDNLCITMEGDIASCSTDSCESPFRYLSSKIILSQYTGLKDKNGKEIYEGDIYETWYSRDTTGNDIVKCIEIVEYDINEFSGKSGFMDIIFKNNVEVIGNIYEHPHLLNQQP